MAAHELSPPLRRSWRWAARPEKTAALCLLLVLLSAATFGVVTALQAAQWSGLWPSVFVGALATWTMALRPVRARVAAPILIVAGVFAMLVFGGGLGPELTKVAQMAWRLGLAPPLEKGLDYAALAELTMAAGEAARAISVVAARTGSWLGHLLAGRPTFDVVAAAVVWSGLTWFVSAWAAWFTAARNDGMVGVLPALLLTAVTLSDAGEGFTPLLIALAAAMLLVAAVRHDQRERAWTRDRVPFPARKGRQIGGWALAGTVAVIAVAAILSSQAMKDAWESWTRPRASRVAEGSGLSESLGIMSRRRALAAAADAKSPGLPRERLLTIGPDLAERPVMTVELTEPPAQVPSGLTVPFYWRSYTYDVYTGRGWRTSKTDVYQVPANATLGEIGSPFQRLAAFTFRSAGAQMTDVYSDGELHRLDQSAVAELRDHGDQFGSVTLPTAGYRVESILTVVPDSALRSAGQDYPAWLADRFLELPADVPDRVRRLAIELTASEATPFDRAQAIERYLRTLPYSLKVAWPPVGQDVVDYFLFDSEGGYCDYYASAMVVLSRIGGIPARLAIGYASGEYSEKTGRFLVRESDAHSWAELYFPGVGWVPFEATAARPLIDRVDVLADELAPPTPSPASEPASARGANLPGWWGAAIVLVLLVSTGVWMLIDDQRLRRSPLPSVADDIYRQLRRYGNRFGVDGSESWTLLEFSQAIRARMAVLGLRYAGLETDSAASTRQIETVVKGLVLAYYDPNGIKSAERVNEVPTTWVNLRWRLRRMYLRWRWYLSVSPVQRWLQALRSGRSRVSRSQMGGAG